jgi:hypothetical protein
LALDAGIGRSSFFLFVWRFDWIRYGNVIISESFRFNMEPLSTVGAFVEYRLARPERQDDVALWAYAAHHGYL